MFDLAAAAAWADQDEGLVGAYQLAIDQFVDDFRAAGPDQRQAMIARPPQVRDGRLEALLAAVANALCHETGTPLPAWMHSVGTKSPRPFFVLKPEGNCSRNFALAQMLQSPPWFFLRNVFVPDNYLSRA